MNGISLLVVWAALGVVYSWRTGVDGQQEYVLQVEPEVLQSLAAGEEILSEVPADIGHVQRLCIIVLPKGSTPGAHTQLAEERFRQLAISAGRYASADPALASDAQPTILWPSRGNPEQTYGINVGWQPDLKGSQQVFVQLDSTLLRTLSIGDEIYVPIDPAAGRPARFIVKSGKELLPRIGGAQQQLTHHNPAPPPTSPNTRGRLPTTSDSGASSWSNWSANPTGGLASDYGRQPRLSNSPAGTVPGATVPYNGSDPRTGALWNSGGNSYSPAGAMLSAPSGTYGEPAGGQVGNGQYGPAPTQFSGGRASGPTSAAATNNFDKYRQPGLPPNTSAYDLASSTHYPPPGTGQPPAGQYASNGAQQPFDTRLTGGSAAPVGNPVLGATNMSPPGMQPVKKEQTLGAFVFICFALFFSIGGNLYLAYTALEYHSRYRNAIERLRSAARSA